MEIFSKLFGKKNKEVKVGGMEDFMTLIRVYFQASLAAGIGINNLGMLPDLRTFKATLHVPTLNNKLGLGEKNHCKKMMKEIYGIQDDFFKEIDQRIRKNCHKLLIGFLVFAPKMDHPSRKETECTTPHRLSPPLLVDLCSLLSSA